MTSRLTYYQNEHPALHMQGVFYTKNNFSFIFLKFFYQKGDYIN